MQLKKWANSDWLQQISAAIVCSFNGVLPLTARIPRASFYQNRTGLRSKRKIAILNTVQARDKGSTACCYLTRPQLPLLLVAFEYLRIHKCHFQDLENFRDIPQSSRALEFVYLLEITCCKHVWNWLFVKSALQSVAWNLLVHTHRHQISSLETMLTGSYQN